MLTVPLNLQKDLTVKLFEKKLKNSFVLYSFPADLTVRYLSQQAVNFDHNLAYQRECKGKIKGNVKGM